MPPTPVIWDKVAAAVGCLLHPEHRRGRGTGLQSTGGPPRPLPCYAKWQEIPAPTHPLWQRVLDPVRLGPDRMFLWLPGMRGSAQQWQRTGVRPNPLGQLLFLHLVSGTLHPQASRVNEFNCRCLVQCSATLSGSPGKTGSIQRQDSF